MKRMLFQAFATTVSAAAVVASGVMLIAGQQAPAAPVFTIQQAAAGKVTYATNCASCHMPDLSGNNEIPQLTGTAFNGTWGARSTKDLFDYMSAAMPYGGPSLDAETYTKIAAFILQSNGAVAGKLALSASTAVLIGSLTAAPVTPPAVPAPPDRSETAVAAPSNGGGDSEAPASK